MRNNDNFFSACIFSFVGEESNMAVMEISLPSGYVMDDDSLPSLRQIKDVKRIEPKEGGTGVSLYFDKVTRLLYINSNLKTATDDDGPAIFGFYANELCSINR